MIARWQVEVKSAGKVSLSPSIFYIISNSGNLVFKILNFYFNLFVMYLPITIPWLLSLDLRQPRKWFFCRLSSQQNDVYLSFFMEIL